MKKTVTNAAVGLSIIASSLAVSAPAGAFQLQNFANQSLYIGVAAGTMTAGTRFEVWTHDNPVSANQTFSVTGPFLGVGGSPASSVVPGQTYNLFDGGAYEAVVDISRSTASDGTTVVVGYWPSLGSTTSHQLWRVDTAQIMYINRGNTPCYRFINATSTSLNEVLGIGSLQKGTSVITWRTFFDYWNHYDQFWCVVD